MGSLECSECSHECSRTFGIVIVEIYSIAGIKWLEGRIWITEPLLVFLTPAYFLFMPREIAPVDMMSRVLEIVDVRSDILVDFLVELARVVDTVPPSSPLEGLSIITMLVGEMASAGTAIGSWRSGSAIRACRVGRSLILEDLVDLTLLRFKHCGDLGDLWRLLEPSELISGHDQVGAWSLVVIVAVDTNEFVIEVVAKWAWPPLRVELFFVASSVG